MVDESVAGTVRQYLDEPGKKDFDAQFAVLFGSQVSGGTDASSDIDLLVVSPRFDGIRTRQDIDLLRRVAARTDRRIEPIAVGLQQYEEDSRIIVEIARRDRRSTRD